MQDSPAPAPEPAPPPSPPLSTKPPSIPENTSPATRRILIWRHEVSLATLHHPTPPLSPPLRTWQRVERRILGALRFGNGNANGLVNGNGAMNGKGEKRCQEMDEDEAEETRMYELSEREEAVRREAKKTEEWSWDVEGGRGTGSSEGEGRKVEEKEARLERAAELLGRQQGKMEEVAGERRVVV